MRTAAEKFGLLLVTLFAVTALTFGLTGLLEGDPTTQILGPDASDEARDVVRQDLNLDRPVHVRYGLWLADAARGDFGRSYRTRQPVAEAITERAPVTIQIGALALGGALLFAVPLGMVSAYRAGSRLDKGVTTGTFGLLAVPNFMMAMVLIYVFAETLGVLPATGWVNLTDDPVESLKRTILPATALGVAELAVYTRLLRADMMSSLQEDYITMARAKGVPTRRILWRHALRPSSFSLMTVVGVQIGAIIGGAVVIEQLFALPGIGRLLFDSVLQRDLIMVQGVALVIAVSYVVVNFAVDLLYSYLDPRIRT